MKYRRLSNEELQELEKEFIDFLVSNTITAPDWEQLKAEAPEKAETLIELFSDVVFDKVLKKITYLEHRSTKELIIFNCSSDREIELIGLSVSADQDIDLNNEASVASLLLNVDTLEGKIKAFRQKKNYTANREKELFEMLQQGCIITDEKLFNTLHSLF